MCPASQILHRPTDNGDRGARFPREGGRTRPRAGGAPYVKRAARRSPSADPSALFRPPGSGWQIRGRAGRESPLPGAPGAGVVTRNHRGTSKTNAPRADLEALLPGLVDGVLAATDRQDGRPGGVGGLVRA